MVSTKFNLKIYVLGYSTSVLTYVPDVFNDERMGGVVVVFELSDCGPLQVVKGDAYC